MKLNRDLIIGGILTILAIWYWVAWGRHTGMRGMPLLFRFTFRLFPGMQFLLTGAGIYLLVRGISESRNAS